MGTIMRKYVDSYKQTNTLMAERVTSVIPVFLALSLVDIVVIRLQHNVIVLVNLSDECPRIHDQQACQSILH
jgi:hypothetical protein